MSISAQLRDLGIEGLKDKIKKMKLIPAASHGEYGPKRY